MGHTNCLGESPRFLEFEIGSGMDSGCRRLTVGGVSPGTNGLTSVVSRLVCRVCNLVMMV